MVRSLSTELDESWLAEAIADHRRAERLRAAVRAGLASVEISVRSPDELVEVLVGGDGSVRKVNLVGSPDDRTELSRALDSAVSGAAAAADWARRIICAELLAGSGPEPGIG